MEGARGFDRKAERPGKLSGDIIVQDIIELPSFSRAKIINGTQGLDRCVRSVSVLDRTLPHLIRTGQLLLAMGDFTAADASVSSPLADKLYVGNIAALVFKRAAFRADLLEQTIEMAGKAGLAVIELPVETDWRDVYLECVAHLSTAEALLSPARVWPDTSEQIDTGFELQTIADTLSRALGASVTIITPDHHLLAYSALGGPVDSGQQWMIINRRAKQSAIDLMEREGLGEILRRAARPFRLKGIPETGLRPHIWGPIRAGNELLAYISVPENDRRLGRSDKIIVERAAASAAWNILRSRVAGERTQKLKDGLVKELLSKNVRSAPDLFNLASSLSYDLNTFHQILVAEPDDLENYFGRPLLGDGVEGQYVGHRLRHIAGREGARLGLATLTVALGKSVIALVPEIGKAPGCGSPSEARAIADGIREQVGRELPGLAVSIGIGERCGGILDLAESYEQAKQAVWVGRKVFEGNRTLFFEELGVYRILASLKDQKNLEMMRNPALDRLMEYDRREGTELLRTLEVFLGNTGHLNRTAQQLFIHRSTLQYRLERIEAVAGTDLSNAEERLNLQIGLKLLKLLTC